MRPESHEIRAARGYISEVDSLLTRSSAFRALDPATRAAIVSDVTKVRQALSRESPATVDDPYALALDTPADLARLRLQAARQGSQVPQTQPGTGGTSQPGTPPGPRVAATDAIAKRAGALSDEIDFPAFVAGLVHGTFDAVVDASIRQMETFADLVSTVAKGADQFTRENVTPNQVRDWLVQRYPGDLVLEPVMPGMGEPRLLPRTRIGREDEPLSPSWLADYGVEGEELTEELIEERLLPEARRAMGENRLQMLATMVLLGMNRIVVKDGSISAKIRFRAAARDKADVQYASSSDTGGGAGWGSRASSAYAAPTMMVSTVGVNAQTDVELKAELFGEVRINFASDVLPLDRFADAASMALLQYNARTGSRGRAPTEPAPDNGAPAAPPSPTPSTPPADGGRT